MHPEFDQLTALASLALPAAEVAELASVPALLAGCSDDAMIDAGYRAAIARDRALRLALELHAMEPRPLDEVVGAVLIWFRATVWATTAADEMRRRWPEAWEAAPQLH